jgi:protein-tyrosine-phosphatase
VARPRAVLFACQMNAVRSPMAAGLLQQMFPSIRVASVGVAPGDLDPFAVAAMEEVGIDISKHRPIDFEGYEDLEGLDFDLIVTLSPGSNTGRRPIRPRPRAIASSGSTLIVLCAMS